MDLDHVALAATDAAAPLARFVAELGGTVLSGGQFRGFRPVQVRVGDARRGMTVELLEPWDTIENDFLVRFLAGHGDGPHHLTFKVDDFDAALERVAATGRTPVGVNRADPNWMEAFLLPREACGTVVQLAAQRDASPDVATRFAEVEAHGPIGEPWWPPLPASAAQTAVLERVVVRTPDLDEARGFFVDLLTGAEESAGPGALELRWPGGGRLRLEADHPSAGIDRLELAGDAPERILAGTRVVGS
jgi:methylmalonyl-CoA/ethylmalonyl-CoA epimerase